MTDMLIDGTISKAVDDDEIVGFSRKRHKRGKRYE